MTTIEGGTTQTNVTLVANAAQQLEYDATVNPVFNEVTNADIKANADKSLYLSAWNDGHNGLVTKVMQNGNPEIDTSFTEGTTGVLYRVFKVSLYLTHTASTGQKTDAEWTALVNASDETVTFDFSYLKTKDDSVATEIDITADHLPFYYKAQTEGEVTYMDYTSETTSPVKSFASPALKNISKDSANPTQVGYLYLRIDGSSWNHDHDTDNTYKGAIKLAEHVGN